MTGIAGLRLQVPLRPSQRRLVEVASQPQARDDGRLHLSAPPGSGKTLVGLELARRLGVPTLVLAPTTTIVGQWRDEVGLLLGPDQRLEDWVSTDPERPGPFTVLTYQALTVTARPDEMLRDMARQAWREEFVDAGHPDPAGHLQRLADADARAFRRELRTRAARIRRSLLRDGGDVHRFLHPNARAHVDRLVAHGVRTVVLDECHHLLDHWAIVLLDLFERLDATAGPPQHAIGLTATLPEPSSSREQETYAAVLGAVDVEIPTPVVVAEGSLAPYRDLVVFVTPTPTEQAFLDDLAGAFTVLVADITTHDSFVSWLVAAPLAAALDQRYADHDVGTAAEDRRRDAWGAWLRERPVLAGAVLRAHRHLGLTLPSGVPIPADAEAPWGVDDQITLLEAFAADVLQVSSDPDHRRLLSDLREVLTGFGLSLTSTGIRRGRSPVDVVVALSEAKADATARILATEHAALGDRLRALVVSDVDRASTAVARLRGALDADAGSARRLHRRLVVDVAAGRLDPVLVTGTTVRAGNVLADDLAVAVNLWFADRRVDAWCEAVPVDDRVQELVGHGSDWSPRAYVPAITAAFEDGRTRCLVGTRGLFGQGWDAPSCNTLVDLTAVTTATAARQLQGRILRTDPAWPAKASHRWDVVCVAGGTPGGDADLDRFRRRHDRLWGLAVDGRHVAIARGVEHVDADLARAVADGATPDDLERATARSFDRVGDRSDVADTWGAVEIGEHSEVRSVARIRPRRHTAHVPAPRRRWPWVAGAGWSAGAVAMVAGAVAAAPPVAVAGAVVAAGSGVAGWWRSRRAAASALVGLTDRDAALTAAELDLLLTAAGRAVRGALVATRDLPEYAGSADVRVTRSGDEAAVRLVDPPERDLLPAHHRAFAEAVTTLLGPVREPRYLLDVRSGRRQILLPAPDRLAGRKEHATALARHLARELHTDVEPVFAHTDAGRRAIVDAWAQRRRDLRVDATDRWV